MSRKSVQRFCENDMHKNKDLKRVAWIHFSATRFSDRDRTGTRGLSGVRTAASVGAIHCEC
ncbi:MAG: hypothetical protein E5W38_03760 [Mesorhizobium sp.]|nr:hypothetical protein EJ070_12485 [Mesorhizobium sp. M1E.F.Ca.ET.045.02.1.1]RUW37855.1 hypothetical protein EOA38_02755 [Mesorhizobium sp. M1E.F.Ca.ET.041.01.1.1]RUW84292.1 hypothetical protein EOA29_09910 [Mesorhizobium sp. M1E.F.Ca.ET.063.01.1.1]RWD91328.1 MAG: hypothetical protein EOS38_05590 [Mesorhizobium sp.]RWD94614.1 MAG: hypothetical protein EOS39_06045 [Mesorhizobium sp.]